MKTKEQYKGISVTDDYTIKHRNMIKEWIEKAKKTNEEEPTESQYEWKVRGTPKKRDAPEEVPETESQCLEIIENIAIQEVSNLETGIISKAVEQNNKIQNISKESYLTEYANANEVNSNDIGKRNIFKVDHSKWGTAKCGLCKKPIVKDGLRIRKSTIFESKHILWCFQFDCAFGSFQKARIAKNVISDISQLDGADNLNDQEKSLLSELIEKGNKSRTTPLPEINSRRKKYPMQAPAKIRRAQCQVAMNVMFTNADQLTSTS